MIRFNPTAARQTIEADAETKTSSEPWLFIGLGAWSAFMFCMMHFKNDLKRDPASEPPGDIAPLTRPTPPQVQLDESYFLSFNSIHFEK